MDHNSTNNPLIVTLNDQEGSKTNHAAKVWFQKPLFVRLEDEHDMDIEVELSMRKLKKSKKSSHDTEMIVKPSMEETAGVKVTKDVDVINTDTDGDSTESYEEEVTKTTKGYNPKGDTFEVVLIEKSLKWLRHPDEWIRMYLHDWYISILIVYKATTNILNTISNVNKLTKWN